MSGDDSAVGHPDAVGRAAPPQAATSTATASRSGTGAARLPSLRSLLRRERGGALRTRDGVRGPVRGLHHDLAVDDQALVGLDARGDRHGECGDVVDNERCGGEQPRAQPEVAVCDRVRTAPARVGEDRLPVRERDDRKERGDRERDRKIEARPDGTGE